MFIHEIDVVDEQDAVVRLGEQTGLVRGRPVFALASTSTLPSTRSSVTPRGTVTNRLFGTTDATLRHRVDFPLPRPPHQNRQTRVDAAQRERRLDDVAVDEGCHGDGERAEARARSDRDGAMKNARAREHDRRCASRCVRDRGALGCAHRLLRYYALRRDHARGVGMDDGRFRTFVVVVAVVVVAGVVVGVEDVDFFWIWLSAFVFVSARRRRRRVRRRDESSTFPPFGFR